ncbi:Hsp20/alpha crystallin family protein [Danxiaibacter flavus]|uniref:Hsp20/alpha crystallin family protein n=1 Tax=Danxiaibacter flavus TaxID=3049108 RepID=A0ABV3ZAY2_9BACT|nr:Hsp20/alpha crystallin family protein [Chitinophagaceae bacterium DXS]
MTLVKRNYRTFDNLFDELFNNIPAAWGKEAGWNVPPVNIHETEDAYHLELVAPGLAKEDFKVNLEKGLLTISFEKKNETENKEYKTHRREFSATSFKRSFTVDDKVNAEGIQAKYDNGVLKLFLPKKEEVKALPKEITIQ